MLLQQHLWAPHRTQQWQQGQPQQQQGLIVKLAALLVLTDDNRRQRSGVTIFPCGILNSITSSCCTVKWSGWLGCDWQSVAKDGTDGVIVGGTQLGVIKDGTRRVIRNGT
eukprot:GHUV01003721.1.p4 GENE.GHUV01003721.1~~GHUV01003721.1.p4  ORF type:complete len:110 (+),score=33.54 GHUV01003721.1:596-925(+)